MQQGGSIREYLEEIADMDVGSTRNFNHCKVGKSNARFYITRNSDGFLYYCHHCSYKGVYREAGSYRRPGQYAKRLSNTRGKKEWELPKDLSYDICSFPVRARAWIYKARLDTSLLADNGIGFSPSMQRIILGVSREGKLLGFQSRSVFPWDKGPKYKTYKNVSELYYELWSKDATEVCLCEDILSAVRLSKFISSVALLGTNLPKELFKKLITSKVKKVFIFLDDDNYEVKKRQLDIQQKLCNFAEVKIIRAETDPKNLSDLELEKKLWS